MPETEEEGRTVTFTDDEVAYLDDILSMWIDGYADAKETTIVDPAIVEPEDLLILTESLKTQEVDAVMIRYKLREAMYNG